MNLLKHISRRGFLKLGAASGLALGSARVSSLLAQTSDHSDELVSFNELYNNPPMLGRVHGAFWIRMFDRPEPGAKTITSLNWGAVVPILEGIRTVPYDAKARSDVWFRTDVGYVHSAYVVPSREMFQAQTARMSDSFWGEVMVPIAYQHTRPELGSYRYDFDHYKLFWGQVYKVIDYDEDAEGRGWYRLDDDLEPNRQAWVMARNIRRVDPNEFQPISADVGEKRILISLDPQTLTCFEGDVPVFKTRIASGSSFQDDEGNEVDFTTPFGDYAVQRKRPTRRMRGNVGTSLEYDVNAVPWVTYFDFTGAAIHGAYWHNNFGRPRSHGCINVTPDAAKWIYRWTAPHGGYDEEYLWTEPGEVATPIQIA